MSCMLPDEAKEFGLKFIRRSRPETRFLIQNWAADWGLSVSNFHSGHIASSLSRSRTFKVTFVAVSRNYDRPDRSVSDLKKCFTPSWTRKRSRSRRSEEHTSELQSLMRISYAVFCLKKKKHKYMIIH